ncbi:MAG TPA: carotenoid oxygenase family protein [Acidimicrobiales bacterium]|nr:carotenoid oxygenase family protein [Acidimicrobiales bacterium]
MTLGPAIPRATGDWSVALGSLDIEHPEPLDLTTRGHVPSELLGGTLYLGGPAGHDVHGSRGASWLDGDGMVHAVRLGSGRSAPGGATYQSRFVATKKKGKEDRAGRRLYATLGAPAPGGAVARLWRSRPQSPANAGVVAHDGRLFALWDGAPPYELDPETLATRGQYDLDGLLRARDGFASAPVVDPESGDLWNLGGRPGRRLRIGLYHWPRGGRPRLVASARLPYRTVVRSFALTPTKAVFVLSPLVARLSPAVAVGQRPLTQMLRWRPELGSPVGIIDRVTGACRWVPVPPLVVSAVAQAYDDADTGELVVDVSTYPDAGMIGATTDMMQGSLTAKGYATLERLRIGPRGLVERSLLPPLDWPAVATPHTPGPDARIYGINLNPMAGFPGTLAAVHMGTAKVDWVPPLAHEVASPPVAVHRGRPWVFTVVTDLAARTSEVRVLDGDRVGGSALFAAELPCVVPFGARGCWVDQRK